MRSFKNVEFLNTYDFQDEQEDEEDDCVWDGWEKLDEDLKKITEDPVEIKKLHFSFETVPLKESWFLTYQLQDRGDEIVFYPSSTTNPFYLPYQLPYSAFLLNKPVKRDPESSHDQSKASSPVRQSSETSKQGEKRKSRFNPSQFFLLTDLNYYEFLYLFSPSFRL